SAVVAVGSAERAQNPRSGWRRTRPRRCEGGPYGFSRRWSAGEKAIIGALAEASQTLLPSALQVSKTTPGSGRRYAIIAFLFRKLRMVLTAPYVTRPLTSLPQPRG